MKIITFGLFISESGESLNYYIYRKMMKNNSANDLRSYYCLSNKQFDVD